MSTLVRNDTDPGPGPARAAARRRPRLGFLGTGWIGRHRLEAVASAGVAEIAAICEPDPAARTAALACGPQAREVQDLSQLLAIDELDGIVIATPSAQHADQSIAALQAGLAVFCQKPLGRDAPETRRVVAAARAADRLLAVDLSYRKVRAVASVVELLQAGAIGPVHAVDLTFHNAYGPDKPWFYDRSLSGGGCVTDLGVHLVDLFLWALGDPAIVSAEARLFANGRPLGPGSDAVEDLAFATFGLEGGCVVRLACSWKLNAGQDAEISGVFHGTEGALAFHNVDGSFFHFRSELRRGTRREPVISVGEDDWGGRTIVAWAERLGSSRGYDRAADRLVAVAAALDRLYGR